jgi:putative transposase
VSYYRTPLRRPASDYIGARTHFLTICAKNRRSVFLDASVASSILEDLSTHASKFNFDLHAFCLMPDHVHLLAGGTDPRSDLLKFVHQFKQRSGYNYRRQHRQQLWQERFHDHILRRNDHIEDVACYIWWNPVRAGLCQTPEQYPWSGSQTIDWMSAAGAQTEWIPPWRVELRSVGAIAVCNSAYPKAAEDRKERGLLK